MDAAYWMSRTEQDLLGYGSASIILSLIAARNCGRWKVQ
jgi:hypothetical protein